MKSLNTAIFLYTDDNDGYVPAAPNKDTPWDDLLIGYDGQNREIRNDEEFGFNGDVYGNSLKLYHCPENEYSVTNSVGATRIRRSYALNCGIENTDPPTNAGKSRRGLSMYANDNTQWSMKLSAINDTATAIMMTEINTDNVELQSVLGSHFDDVLNSEELANHVKYNPTKHVKPFSQNYLFVDGHVSLMSLQSLSGGSGADMFEGTDASGTYFDCQD